MMLACEVSDMDFTSFAAIDSMSSTTSDNQQQELWVIDSQSGNMVIEHDKTVIHHQHEFVTTQLGLKTLRKRAA